MGHCHWESAEDGSSAFRRWKGRGAANCAAQLCMLLECIRNIWIRVIYYLWYLGRFFPTDIPANRNPTGFQIFVVFWIDFPRKSKSCRGTPACRSAVDSSRMPKRMLFKGGPLLSQAALALLGSPQLDLAIRNQPPFITKLTNNSIDQRATSSSSLTVSLRLTTNIY